MPAGGAPPRFVDDAEAAGLRFTFDNGADPLRQIPETTAGGVGLLDYDGDGWLDVYLVQGGPFPPEPETRQHRRPPLPQPGRRHVRGRDREVRASPRCPGATATAWPSATSTTTAIPTSSSPDGGPTPSTGTGATARSRTPPSAAGLGGDRDWPTSAAFADLDGDGDLDLYVCHYLEVGRRAPPLCRTTLDGGDPTGYCGTPQPFPSRARPPLPQRRRPVRRRDRRRPASSTATGGASASSRPTSTTTAGSTCSSPTTRRPTSSCMNLGGMRFEEVGAAVGRRQQRRRAGTRRAWGSPAATSTATAGPTWP